ncbi:MAG: histidine phosphatase family protein [Brevundimonas sp.]
MTTTLYLIRHAEHDLLGQTLCGRMEGVGLGETGRAQAGRLAGRLAALGVARVFSSPVQRAVETAAPLAQALNLPVEVAPELDELDFGCWTGRRFEELAEDPAWRVWNSDRGRARPPSGETMLEAQARASTWLHRLIREPGPQPCAAVSHGDLIKALVAHVLGLPLHFHDRLEISPASVTTMVGGDWGLKIHNLNEVVA